MDPDQTVFLTGGTGVVGRAVAERFARDGVGVHLLVRKESRKGARAWLADLRERQREAADRVRLLTGDLLRPLDDEVRDRVREDCAGVVHCASERRPDADRGHTFELNIEATRRMLALGKDLDGPMLHVSDLRVHGDRTGVAFESDLLAGQGFPDAAAESRMLAERHAVRAMAKQPVTILRLAHPRVATLDPTRRPDPLAAPRRPALGERLRARFEPPRYAHVLPVDFLAAVVLAAWRDEACRGQTLHVADPFAPTARELLGGAWPSGPLPGEGVRLDTTAFDGLLRRSGRRR